MTYGKVIGINGDGMKSLPLNNVEAWIDAGFGDWFSGSSTGRITAPGAFSASGWTYRCVHVRSAALTAVPWSVYRGENEIYSSDGNNAEQQADLSWLRNVKTLLYATEAALSIVGEAYWHKVRTRGRRIDSLKYIAPGTMSPNWGASNIETFDRQINGMRYRLPADDVLYYRLPNPLHETDPGVSPVEAALADIGVMVNLNTFAASFFKRGAIRTTLLTVDGVPQPAEREKLKSWWKRAVSGIGNAFSTEVVSASVTPVVVGDGIESLNNEALTTEKRESISTALGVPHSLVLSNAANFATAEADRLTFYDLTILPDAEIIAEAMNQQLFESLGLRFVFRPQSMNIYQENEEQRAGAFAAYVNAGMPKSLVAEMLGIDIPPGWEYTDLDPQAQPVIQSENTQNAEPDGMVAAPENEEDSKDGAAKRAEVKALKKWLKKRSNPDLAQFNAEFLSDEEKYAIAAEVGQMHDQKEDGTAEDTPFGVEVPIGSITRDAWKAIVLQLDNDDDEAEQAIRMAVERRNARNLRNVLARINERMVDAFPEDFDPTVEAFDLRRAARLTRGEEEELYDTINRMLQESADLGVNVAIDQLENVGFGFDWTLANTTARDWAAAYTVELTGQINATTGRMVSQAVSRWIDNSETLDSLIADLAPVFGQKRAELIASTEVTRAFAEGNRIAYRESGVVTEWEWRTAADERVCPICGPLAGKRRKLSGEPFSVGIDAPPAHPRCRCWVTGVIQEGEEA